MQDKVQPEQICLNPDCGLPFLQSHHSQQYCTKDCRDRATYSRRAARIGRFQGTKRGVPNGRICTNPECTTKSLTGRQRLVCSERCRVYVYRQYKSPLRKNND